MIRILKKCGLMLLAITAMGLVWASDVHAGYNADGKPGEYNYEEDGLPSVRATTIIMQNGGNYDVSKFDGATYLRCSSSGTYYLTGTTDKTMLVIESHPGDDIQIILNGVSMTATWRCPGAAANARSAIEITGNGGKVTFVSNENTKNYFESKGVGVINASPLSMGLLSSRGAPAWHPAPAPLAEACTKAAQYCVDKGYPIEKLAIQFLNA